MKTVFIKGKGPNRMEVHVCLRHGEIQPLVPIHQASFIPGQSIMAFLVEHSFFSFGADFYKGVTETDEPRNSQ